MIVEPRKSNGRRVILMSGMLDYLTWRGDLSLEQAEFNNIDALILSCISYIPFDGIVSESVSEQITISEATNLFLKRPSTSYVLNLKEDVQILKEAAKSIRFKDMQLSGFIDDINNELTKQFSAIVIDTMDGVHFVAYRGTGQSLIGWKEDFNMSFTTPVPSQETAVKYLEKIAKEVQGNIRLGGHSKGGNLAVYASTFCSKNIQSRITSIYNNDGPGFESGILNREEYRNVSKKIQTFIPESSIVGLLLEHEEDYKIITSNQSGLLQHNIHSWEIIRDDFVYTETLSKRSKRLDKTLREWLTNMSYEQRTQFVEAIFSIFEATNAKTVKELTDNWYENAKILLYSMNHMDESMKRAMSRTLRELLKASRNNRSIKEKKSQKREYITIKGNPKS